MGRMDGDEGVKQSLTVRVGLVDVSFYIIAYNIVVV